MLKEINVKLTLGTFGCVDKLHAIFHSLNGETFDKCIWPKKKYVCLRSADRP